MDVARVLIATDGSSLAVAAARRSLNLLDPASKLTVASVAQPPTPVVPAAPMGAPVVGTELFDDQDVGPARDRAQAAANELLAVLAAAGAEADTVVLEGSPGEALCRFAADGRFDAIVIGSHGSGFVKRVLVGSVSHHVLHHAPCPVLVVREPDDGG